MAKTQTSTKVQTKIDETFEKMDKVVKEQLDDNIKFEKDLKKEEVKSEPVKEEVKSEPVKEEVKSEPVKEEVKSEPEIKLFDKETETMAVNVVPNEVEPEVEVEDTKEFIKECVKIFKTCNYFGHLACGRHLKDEITSENIKKFYLEFVSYGISCKNDADFITLCKKEFKD